MMEKICDYIGIGMVLLTVGLFFFFIKRIVDVACPERAQRSFERCLEKDPANIETCKNMLQALERSCEQ